MPDNRSSSTDVDVFASETECLMIDDPAFLNQLIAVAAAASTPTAGICCLRNQMNPMRRCAH
jgi:hypothetical protein